MKTIYTGAKCTCKRGIERDNCPRCEGTGRVIDFAAMRKMKTEDEPETPAERQQRWDDYEEQDAFDREANG